MLLLEELVKNIPPNDATKILFKVNKVVGIGRFIGESDAELIDSEKLTNDYVQFFEKNGKQYIEPKVEPHPFVPLAADWETAMLRDGLFFSMVQFLLDKETKVSNYLNDPEPQKIIYDFNAAGDFHTSYQLHDDDKITPVTMIPEAGFEIFIPE